MKYLLSLYANPDRWGPGGDERPDGLLMYADGAAAVREQGELICHEVVADPSTSAVVRVDNGVVSVSDGPYLRTREQLASCYIVDCESLERAVELAARIPAARSGGIEVRPLMRSAGLEM
jgi:hypothetical protein